MAPDPPEESARSGAGVAVFLSPMFLEHRTGKHPECPARLETVYRRLQQRGTLRDCVIRSDVAADPNELQHVHAPEYIAAVRKFAEQGGGRIEADTVVSPHSYDVALRAAGTAMAAVDIVLGADDRKHAARRNLESPAHAAAQTADAAREDDTKPRSAAPSANAESPSAIQRALCLLRPPGHHARPQNAMGFCLFNNVAVAAAHALTRHELDRVLIVDWDVHHGNGTQEIFYETDRVHFVSIHRSPFYPGTGDADETGAGPGLGATWNAPIRFGTPPKAFHAKFADIVQTAAARCRPQLVLVSAGFDAHHADPIGSLGLESQDFHALTRVVRDIADQYAAGRLVSLLEGGYNLQALAESVEIHLAALTAPAR